ncbi:MAG: purine-nucleoside phosphorylase [Ignavibacteriales bacterium]
MKFDYSFIYKDLLESVKNVMPFQPEISIVLGSGLGTFATSVTKVLTIKTSDLPQYPTTNVQGHKGFIHFAQYAGKNLLLFEGRIHFYEGHSIEATLLPIFISKYLTIKKLLLTNAAGGINPNFVPGDLMIIKDFNSINLKKFFSSKFGISDPQAKNNLNNYPAKNLYNNLINSALTEKIQLKEGSYFWTSGPSYETAAEIRMMQKLGFDSVGMSTVQEILLASIFGIDTIGISCITNMAAGILNKKLNHEEVIETGKNVEDKFGRLVIRFIENL